MITANDVEREAAERLVRLDGQDSAEKWAELDAWLDADPRHRAAFLRLSVAWQRADQLKRLRPFSGKVDPDLLSAGRDRDRRFDFHGRADERWNRWGRRTFGLAAAAALVSVAVGTFTWMNRTSSPAAQIYVTEIGEQRTLVLEDGSTVELNTDSELQVRLSPERRDLKLVRGEALFRVAHDPSRPFEVEAGTTAVRALGTEFSVRMHDPSHVEVIVSRGSVAVVRPHSRTLVAGNAVQLDHGRVTQQHLTKEEVTRRHAWVDGMISLEGATLAEAVREFNRYNRRRLQIVDPEIAGTRVGGSFEARDLETFISVLERTLNVTALPHQGSDRHGVIRLQRAGP